jgi:hypothetical protein
VLVTPALVHRHRIPEVEVIPDKRLGRNFRYDPRDALYPFRRTTQAAWQQTLWDRMIAILNQGNLGSCTGNEAVGALGTGPIWRGLPASHPDLVESFAVKIYSRATVIDDGEGYTGQYPPTDTGSDGVSAAKACQELGLISGYTHCTTIAQMIDALQVGPVGVGADWYSSFDSPNTSGLVTIAKSAYVRGGHEWLVRGDDGTNFFCDNSWGLGFGIKGSFLVSRTDMERLLGEGGDCTVPVPATAPAPAPIPVPTPPGPGPFDPADNTFFTDTIAWAAARHTGSNARAAAARNTWARAKGLL